ncbi:[protein-PII] uridylyltransferase [Actinokineospora terrae]|uniref:Bifunctional uridylyltransferase/uridylyl-removing enzyme n=1 Tax=Actinokineospora terrae TaxID=155974 RepID=A0A1H9QAZ5_9PSEU|nr:[protein-PII] uridylyltransferase [Actinokineospora terrae]SER57681.1 UTP--GlnB (protein PII) uridylyltransferase, GlnD [Actinokineospora terrae]
MAPGHPATPAAADLLLARDRLLAAAGPRSAAGHRLTPAALREALADLHEFWLTAHADRAGIGGRGGGVALFAVGGLGRREPVPYSDLDLVLAHDGRTRVDDLAERLWYPLWNSGIGLDHSVRTVGEALEVASGDLRTALGLLDARHLAGDAEITARLAASARDRWRSGARTRLGELVESVRARWSRAGEVAHWVEPDLKHGRGGLRDVDVLRALALAQLVDRPDADVTAAHTLLLDTRTELRRIARRPRDVLRPQDGDEVASALGLTDRFALARALSGAGRAVAYALDVALRSTGADSSPRRVLGVLLRAPARSPLDEGVVLHGTEVALARDADPAKDPGLLLRVAAASGRTGHPIAPAALARLSESAPEPRAPWPADVRQDLVALLGAGEGLTDVVEALDRAGLWARLFPEWGAVRDLPPRDAAHVWTVDRHLVRTTVTAARLVTSVSRPDLLLLGALLHDIGKGRDRDHSVVGAALAAQVGTRLGLPKSDVDIVAAVVRHHLLLPHTATRRDIDDETTIHRVVDTLGGDPVLLELLHALAEADSLATGPGVWTEWKARLVADLVAHCRTAMAGGTLPQPDPLDDAQRALAESVATTGRPDVLFEGAGQAATVTLATVDRPGVLSRAAGVLALNSLQVHAATVATHAGIAVGVFAVTPRFGSLPDPSLLREQFTRAISGSLPLAEKLAAKEHDYGGRATDAPAPKVLWFDHEAGGPDPRAVVLELRATDRIGLLHSVATALESEGVDVKWTRATTLGTAAVDAFGFTPPATPHWRTHIEHRVLDAAR